MLIQVIDGNFFYVKFLQLRSSDEYNGSCFRRVVFNDIFGPYFLKKQDARNVTVNKSEVIHALEENPYFYNEAKFLGITINFISLFFS